MSGEEAKGMTERILFACPHYFLLQLVDAFFPLCSFYFIFFRFVCGMVFFRKRIAYAGNATANA